MKKATLILWALLSIVLLVGCNTTNSSTCPSGSEYYESRYENWNIRTQWCFQFDSTGMEWHRIYYFENWWKNTEWDMKNSLEQWEWIFYDEGGNNIIIMKWYYKDGLDDGEWTYYDDEWNYVCTETYSKWKLIDEWDCVYGYEYEE